MITNNCMSKVMNNRAHPPTPMIMAFLKSRVSIMKSMERTLIPRPHRSSAKTKQFPEELRLDLVGLPQELLHRVPPEAEALPREVLGELLPGVPPEVRPVFVPVVQVRGPNPAMTMMCLLRGKLKGKRTDGFNHVPTQGESSRRTKVQTLTQMSTPMRVRQMQVSF